MRGYLYAEYRGLCAKCNRDLHVSEDHTEEEAAAHAREKGWRHDEERGWLCPACVKKEGKDDRKESRVPPL